MAVRHNTSPDAVQTSPRRSYTHNVQLSPNMEAIYCFARAVPETFLHQSYVSGADLHRNTEVNLNSARPVPESAL